MNEIELANQMEALPNTEEGNSATEPPKTADDEAVEADRVPDESTQEDADNPVEDPELFADSVSDPDPAAQEEPSNAEQIAFLRAELSRMQAKLEEKDAFYTRVSLECAEFSTLFPETPLSTSSKMTVGKPSWEAMTVLIASMMRDISPPDALFAMGTKGSPTLTAAIKTTSSVPFSVKRGSPSFKASQTRI